MRSSNRPNSKVIFVFDSFEPRLLLCALHSGLDSAYALIEGSQDVGSSPGAFVGPLAASSTPRPLHRGRSRSISTWKDDLGADRARTWPSVLPDVTAYIGSSNPAMVGTGAQGVAAASSPLPAGLVAGWSFSEASGTSALDSSGNNNTATLNNGVSRGAGKYGGGLTLDGVNDYLSVANSPSLDISGTGLTLSMWINPQSLSGGDSVVLGKFWGTTMASPYYQYGMELDGGRYPRFYVGTSTGAKSAGMGSALALNQWSHLAVVFNGTQVQFYVNGTVVSTVALSASITARGNGMKVGADASISQFFKGSLDELRIYNRALSSQEVQTDMNTAG
jgi:hypothetical protein